VTELLDVLRSGLAALVPVVERLAIPWADGDAYDDWDNIASTLYDQLVVNTSQNAIEVDETVTFAKYDMVYPAYQGLAHFEVVSKQTNEMLGVFVGFAGIDRNFTSAKYVVRGAKDVVDTTTTRSVTFSECTMRLRLPGAENKHVEVLTMGE
jgi:hypothetical protein